MKISFKLFFFIIIIIIISFLIYGIFAYQRDLTNFIRDIKIDAKTLGKALSIEFITVWERDGQSFALNLLDEVNQHTPIRLRWVWLDDDNEDQFIPIIEKRGILRHSEYDTSSFISITKKDKYLCTYIILKTPISRTGAIELYEDLSSSINVFLVNNIFHLGIAAILILTFTFVLIWVIGYFMLSLRISRILGFMKDIGAGNLSKSISINGNDEITAIARGLDTMRIDLKKTEEMLMREKDENIKILEQFRHMDRLAAIGKITSGIAHELGTPLNIISGRAKLLSSFELTYDELIENANIIQDQADNITTIIRNMLTFSRRKKTEKKPENINEIIRKTIDLFGLIKENHRISMELIETENDIIIEADKIQIQQVLSNLILNSIQAIEGEGKIEIGISVLQNNLYGTHDDNNNDTCAIYIKDNGTGIPEKDIENIFKPFFTTKSSEGGTGIGLSLVNDIIKEYKGRIEVKNNHDKGCCFYIYLPLRKKIHADN